MIETREEPGSRVYSNEGSKLSLTRRAQDRAPMAVHLSLFP